MAMLNQQLPPVHAASRRRLREFSHSLMTCHRKTQPVKFEFSHNLTRRGKLGRQNDAAAARGVDAAATQRPSTVSTASHSTLTIL